MKTLSQKSVLFTLAHKMTRENFKETFEFIGEYSQVFKIMLKRAHALQKAESVKVETQTEVNEASNEASLESKVVVLVKPSSLEGFNVFSFLSKKYGRSFNFILDAHVGKKTHKGWWIEKTKKLLNSDLIVRFEGKDVYYFAE